MSGRPLRRQSPDQHGGIATDCFTQRIEVDAAQVGRALISTEGLRLVDVEGQAPVLADVPVGRALISTEGLRLQLSTNTLPARLVSAEP